ncbi:MAG: hypothetical protein H0T10_05055 [Actinobacteria bacterium]|nr:hypothetical protein [Actinomycetota bacterium]
MRFLASTSPRSIFFFRRGQERIAAGFVEEELEGVGRRAREVAVDVREVIRVCPAAVVGEGDAAFLDLRVERLELVFVQLQILHGGAELGKVETAGNFTGVEKRCERLATHRPGSTPQPAAANPLSERDI